MQRAIQKEAPAPHLIRRKIKLLSSLKVCFLILIGSGLFVGQANASQALVGMPFTGKWAYNALVSPPYTDSNSSHPSVHHTPGGGDWATDVYAAEGTAVKLDVTYPTSGVSFSWKTTSTTCGQSTGVNVVVAGTTVGWLYFAHLNSAVTSGTITNGMTLGTVHDWGGCNPGVHVHIESKNSSNYSCYADNGQPGVTVNYGANFGVLGSSNSGAQQACASTPGGTQYQTAFQANTGYLYTYNAVTGATNLSQGMATGTSPAIAKLSDGLYEIAFQTNTGALYLYNSLTGVTSTTLGMASGTSPAITAFSTGAFEVVFQANTGALYTYNSSSGAAGTSLGMASGTSPSISTLTSSAFQVAFQANTGSLYVYNSTTGATNLSQGMASATNASISTLTSTAYEIAFQANTGSLYVYNSANGATNLSQGMATGTSPSIATLDSSHYQIAYQANTNYLYVYNSAGGASSLSQGMTSNANPSIAAASNAAYQIAFKSNTGHLFTYDYTMTAQSTVDTSQGMASGTSSAIAW